VEESPRHVLRRVLSSTRSRGFEVCIGLELEFYLFRDRECVPPPAGKQVYHLRQTPAEARVLRAILDTMEALGIPAEAGFPEDAPGQLEVVLPPAPALEVADAAFLVRNLAKEIASQQGLFCTFLSKPLADESGSGLHIHQSLASLSSGLSAFYDGTQEGGLSHLLRHYLAGQLAYLPQAFALYLPTINAYKRALNREHGGLAATWGFDNRTAALRVLGRSPGSLRLENRVAGGEANPYLAIAACVATGLAGIEADLEPPTPTTGNAYAPVSDHQLLPTNLRHALDLLDGSRILREALGEAAVDRFLALKWDEVRRFESSITDWERAEYLDLF
jgi:glutamine synthetase